MRFFRRRFEKIKEEQVFQSASIDTIDEASASDGSCEDTAKSNEREEQQQRQQGLLFCGDHNTGTLLPHQNIADGQRTMELEQLLKKVGVIGASMDQENRFHNVSNIPLQPSRDPATTEEKQECVSDGPAKEPVWRRRLRHVNPTIPSTTTSIAIPSTGTSMMTNEEEVEVTAQQEQGPVKAIAFTKGVSFDDGTLSHVSIHEDRIHTTTNDMPPKHGDSSRGAHHRLSRKQSGSMFSLDTPSLWTEASSMDTSSTSYLPRRRHGRRHKRKTKRHRGTSSEGSSAADLDCNAGESTFPDDFFSTVVDILIREASCASCLDEPAAQRSIS